MRALLLTIAALAVLLGPAAAARLDIQAVNDAQWRSDAAQPATGKQATAKKSASKKAPAKGGIDPLLIKAQVLLDRARFSPGEIDGRDGENFRKALAEFAAARGLSATPTLTEEALQKLASASPVPVLTQHALTEDDVRGPFLDKLPPKMEAMKDLPALGYVNVREKLAEKFHMSEGLLVALNPDAKFAAGDTIVVAGVGAAELPEKVARIEVDKTAQRLRAFGKDQKLIASYPATVGSEERPAPTGALKVAMVATNPTYRYNPKYAFKEVKTTEPFKIKPGPNNPVGLAWIGLAPGEGFGIHGTPEPSKVSKTSSHGCVRLTNWDAVQLAAATVKGTPVEFVGDEAAARQARAQAARSARR
jgi:lipoprotein-anchoring transpeptidase ErfK/SrfK